MKLSVRGARHLKASSFKTLSSESSKRHCATDHMLINFTQDCCMTVVCVCVCVCVVVCVCVCVCGHVLVSGTGLVAPGVYAAAGITGARDWGSQQESKQLSSTTLDHTHSFLHTHTQSHTHTDTQTDTQTYTHTHT